MVVISTSQADFFATKKKFSYRPQRSKVRQGSVFTRVCHSVHRAARHGPPLPTVTTTAADGTHPTGMHSCYCEHPLT